MLTAIILLLAAVVVYLLLKADLDRAVRDVRLNGKREARSRRAELKRSADLVNEAANDVRLTVEAAHAIAVRALKAAAEMSERFDRGEEPKDNRRMFSLSDLRKPAEERNAERIAAIKAENERRRQADEERLKIRDTEIA